MSKPDSQAASDTPLPRREVAVWSAGLRGRCPRCNQGKLFAGTLRVAVCCPVCGLELQKHEKGDGPAFFAITLIGTMLTALAVIVELLYMPPYWLHAVLWLPLGVAGVLLSLRWGKGVIIAMQYKHRVDEFAHDN